LNDPVNNARQGLSPVVVIGLGVLVPLVVCLLLSAVRDQIENTNAALILVLVVVGAASTGNRLAGLTAAAVSAFSFDFFLTMPYQDLRIHARSDIETTLLLVLIGAAVTELALWGRRQQARASEQRGYLDGILQTTGTLASSSSAGTVIEHVELQLEGLLDLDQATFVRKWTPDGPILERDGTLTRGGRPLDVDRSGLPTDTEIMLPVVDGNQTVGAFRLVAATHIARPTRQQCQVAVLLGDEVATALRREVNH
jgi:K+-sensing histidine kinase KdpD